MNVTFMIGNGFDLRIGMKTRFVDMYEEYVTSDSATDNIRHFKAVLKADAPNYTTWGDFEMAMAWRIKDFETEEDFIECLRDFKQHMKAHLQHEQYSFENALHINQVVFKKCSDEIMRSLAEFYRELTPNVVNEIDRLREGSSLSYRFVSFNYTSVFDYLLPKYYGEVIHIHGTLDEGASVGIDNIEQIAEPPFTITKKFKRAFIKTFFNESYNKKRLQKAEQIIEDSDIICVYGMSLGQSDFSWITKLKNWLLADERHHLIYFVYDEQEFDKFNWDAIMDEEEDRIATLLGKICDNQNDMNNIFNQIHIPVCYDIFGVKDILKNAENEVAQRNRIQQEMAKRPKELAT